MEQDHDEYLRFIAQNIAGKMQSNVCSSFHSYPLTGMNVCEINRLCFIIYLEYLWFVNDLIQHRIIYSKGNKFWNGNHYYYVAI